MKIAIIGYGHVGRAMFNLFKDAYIYDEPQNIGTREEVNKCDVAFICVPTPKAEDGSCDTSIVEDVLSWVNCPNIVLRSTVYVGFTDKMVDKYHKNIIFQPEYYGETPNHPFADLSKRTWLTFGGDNSTIDNVVKTYLEVMPTDTKILRLNAKDVELAKYMENSFLALKVTFCNEMYDIAESLGCDYEAARKAWSEDPRIGASHSLVYLDNRGYDGGCLPKDVSSIIFQAKENNVDTTLLDAMVEKNNKLRKDY